MTLLEVLVPHPPPLRTEEGGTIRVGDTRVTLDTVIGAYHNGCSAEEIVLKYPTLNITDVYAVLTYYRWYSEPIEAYLTERRQQSTHIQQQIEEQFPPEGLRERLLARQAEKAEKNAAPTGG